MKKGSQKHPMGEIVLALVPFSKLHSRPVAWMRAQVRSLVYLIIQNSQE